MKDLVDISQHNHGHLSNQVPARRVRDIQIVKEQSVYKGAFLLFVNYPVIHAPPAATSWASCLFAFIHENLK
ncbi:hypothetical protein R2236_001493 [Cronobacter sakazakii]|uniref:hypothetical protein n=1 Tax=Cronobacter sakazakii TaxID=28141 RepID=UPI001BCCB387|nr:hypothetical protein [Cronobacter sakazakii]ELQ6071171.1 hypothetical protein [Cronobacter sakazakii]ELY2664776.1 hypothetical protein [Cronobacter sakazakii]MBS4465654.1 hypothetical protein [Cronobacter sakazakii]MBS4469735.1 hypothetical protein [Cronobacter sakazakii]MBS4474634.1 hypothetical protein [Cronobacter sakazakii]